MTDCQMVHQRGPKVIHDHQSCIACRESGGRKTNIEPLLAPGVFYSKCTLLVRPENACEPLTALADIDAEKDRIVAVTKCDIDLTDTTAADNCGMSVLTNVGLDPNYLCWPEGATAEQIDMLMRTSKDCIWFVKRFTCTEVPPELQYLLESKVVANQKSDATSANAVPLAAKSKKSK